MTSRTLLWLLVLATLWGPSFLFIKIAVAEIPPISMVTVRVGSAALLLFLLLRLRGRQLPPFGLVWRHFAWLGFLAHVVPFVSFSWGEQYIDSALASILNGTTPLFTIVIAHFFIDDERLTLMKTIGTVVGFSGLLMLIYPELISGIDGNAAGTLAAVVASLSYALAMVYARRNVRGLPALVAPTAQLTMATLFMVPLSLWIDRPFWLPTPSVAAIGSVIALAVIGTAVAYVVYYHIIEITGATSLAMVTYLVPTLVYCLGLLSWTKDCNGILTQGAA